MNDLPERAARAYRRILEAEGLPVGYPAAVMAEVEALLRAPGVDDPRLVDRTDVPFVTIDYESSRDLDQAVHIERGPGDRGFVVRYALADAAHYVRAGSALFAEALGRGTSFYLPGFSVPMLPPALSEGIVSLNEKVLRRALVFEMRLDDDGAALATHVERARIRSRAKLTYDGVQALHDDARTSPLSGQAYTESLLLLREVGERRMALARARGVVDYGREEVDVVVRSAEGAGDGRATWEARRAVDTDASRWNEQISLLCNIEGGRLLVGGDVPVPQVQPVFRVHDPPSPDALVRFERIVRALATARDRNGPAIRWQRAPASPQGEESLAAFLDRVRASDTDPRLVAAVERQALVVNRGASYAARPGVHFALGVQPYSRFSAPMREIVGIFTHKEACEQLGLADTVGDPADDERLREAVIASANTARERQRRLEKAVLGLALDELFAEDLARPESARVERTGTILGVAPTRLYVRLDDPPIELKVYTDDLARALGERLRVSDDEVALVGDGGGDGGGVRYQLGDAVRLRTAGFEPKRARWRFHVTR